MTAAGPGGSDVNTTVAMVVVWACTAYLVLAIVASEVQHWERRVRAYRRWRADRSWRRQR